MATATPNSSTPAPRTILIVRLSSIGDVVCTLPLLEGLRKAFPEAKIDWLVDDQAAGLLRGHPQLREVLVFPRKAWYQGLGRPLFKHLGYLRNREYDVAIDVQGNLKSSLNMFFTKAKRKIGFARGYCKEGSFLFVRERVTPPGKRIHRVDKNLSLLGPLGAQPSQRPLPHPPIDPVDARRVNQFLENEKLNDIPLALLHPATSQWGKDKQWPPERFAALAIRIHEELGLLPVITWGPGEKALAERVAQLSQGHARVSFPTATLKEFVALVGRASLFVAGDTGALQIASFLGHPTVGIFGPTDPVIYGPIGPRSVVAQPPDVLIPEKRDRTERSELMEQITVEQVFQLVKAIWEAR